MPANFDGKGSEKIFEQDTLCPQCGHKGAYYLGSEVLHGNPYSPAADTEVNHYYQCADDQCKHEWVVYA